MTRKTAHYPAELTWQLLGLLVLNMRPTPMTAVPTREVISPAGSPPSISRLGARSKASPPAPAAPTSQDADYRGQVDQNSSASARSGCPPASNSHKRVWKRADVRQTEPLGSSADLPGGSTVRPNIVGAVSKSAPSQPLQPAPRAELPGSSADSPGSSTLLPSLAAPPRRDHADRPITQQAVPLRGRKTVTTTQIGSLRDVSKSLALVPGHCVAAVSYTHLRAHETDS